MKTLLLVLCAVLVALPAHAGFRLPNSAFTIDQIDEAVAKAKSEKKPITFMMSNVDTTCPLCANASTQIVNSLRTPTVLVYIRNWDGVPKAARSVLNTGDQGKYIPWAGVVDPGFTKLLGMVTYEQIDSQGNRAFTDVRREISAFKGS